MGTYTCDDKFVDVLACCQERGWVRLCVPPPPPGVGGAGGGSSRAQQQQGMESQIAKAPAAGAPQRASPATTTTTTRPSRDHIDLHWRNLATTDFRTLRPHQLVNHLENASVLSNKALLAALLDTAAVTAPPPPPPPKAVPAAADGAGSDDGGSGGGAGAAGSVDDFFPRCWNMRTSGPGSFLRAFGVHAAVAALLLAAGEVPPDDAPPPPLSPPPPPPQQPPAAVVEAALSVVGRWVAWALTGPRRGTKHVPGTVLAVGSSEWRALVTWCEERAARDGGADAVAAGGGGGADAASRCGRARAALAAWRQLDPQAQLSDGGMNAWILKPAGLSCGEGVQVYTSLRALAAASAARAHRVVVQKYCEIPMLLPAERKFDVRQWVLVTSTAPLVVWGFSAAYARCARAAYTTAAAAAGDRFVHLCNYAVQKEYCAAAGEGGEEGGAAAAAAEAGGGGGGAAGPSPAWEPPPGGTAGTCDECDSMWSARRLREHMRAAAAASGSGDDGADPYADWVVPRMRAAAVAVLLAATSPAPPSAAAASAGGAPLPPLRKRARGFELLGFDFLLPARSRRAHLLEVNVSPDVSHSTPVTAALTPAAARDALALLVDEGHAAPLRRGGGGGAGGGASVRARRVRRELYDPHARVRVDAAPDGEGGGGGEDGEPCWQLWYWGGGAEGAAAARGAPAEAAAAGGAPAKAAAAGVAPRRRGSGGVPPEDPERVAAAFEAALADIPHVHG